jgi:hypothetical protein
MPEITTIKIEKTTKSRVDKLKEDRRESYNNLIKKMLYILNAVRKNPDSAKRILSDIDKNISRKKQINKEFKDISKS